MSLRSLHIPASPSLWTYGTGLIVVLAYFAASYTFHHTRVGAALRDIPIVYFVGFYLTFAVAPAAGILGHLAAGRPAVLGWLGLGLGVRDISAAVAAFTFGSVVASFVIGARVNVPGGFGEAARLFAHLWVATASEALVLLGVVTNLLMLALRELWKDAPRWGPEAIAATVASTLFGVFHVSHLPPLDGVENAPLLAFGWISTSVIFVLSRSLLAATLFLTTLSLVAVIEHAVEFQHTTQFGVIRIAAVLAVLIGTLWLSNPGNRHGRHGGES